MAFRSNYRAEHGRHRRPSPKLATLSPMQTSSCRPSMMKAPYSAILRRYRTAERLTSPAFRNVIKNGAQPALLCVNGKIDPVPAIADVQAVDTSGAGDAFNGGYLAGRLLGREPLVAAAFAIKLPLLRSEYVAPLTSAKLLRRHLRPLEPVTATSSTCDVPATGGG